jgi:hypothetical protein
MVRELNSEIVVGQQCPDCPNVGWYPYQTGYQEWAQVQCQFCYTEPCSMFNIKRLVRDAIRNPGTDSEEQ